MMSHIFWVFRTPPPPLIRFCPISAHDPILWHPFLTLWHPPQTHYHQQLDFFSFFWYEKIKISKKRGYKLQNDRTSYFWWATYPPCPILSYFAWPPLPPENWTSFMYVPKGIFFRLSLLTFLKKINHVWIIFCNVFALFQFISLLFQQFIKARLKIWKCSTVCCEKAMFVK